jgi:hypothetical protein
MRRSVFILISSFFPLILFSQTQLPTQSPASAQLKVIAVHANERINVDGILSESVWQRRGVMDFKQRVPFEGSAPSQATEVWVAYDDEALYVAARMYDTAPDSILQILSRRDQTLTADWFVFYVDPYYDKQSGFFFALSAAGTLWDGTLYNDDWNDDTWDGVWEGEARIDGQGWSVEMRIPYSQLRFHQKASYLWGVNFARLIGRHNESCFLVYTPQKESGFVSRFVDLVGIENVSPPPDIEVLPYVTARAEYTEKQPNNPFNSGSKYLPGLGADFKIGLASNLTLGATLNPDFGQVEVDPAVVNLSDVETAFGEKRPFFIEGANTFRFGRGGASNYWSFNWSDPSFFYSRRIGRAPQGSVPTHDYADIPIGTHILGAGKVTGKVGKWNVGMVHALTGREYARIETAGKSRDVEVEPLTYYGVARAQRDFNEARQGVGLIATLASRSFSDQILRDQINSDALVMGLDGWTFFDSEKSFVLTGWAGVSSVHGNQARMVGLQRNSSHYFQRPDAKHVSVDSSATSLTGYAARFALNKQKGPVLFNAALGLINPKFDVNDLGYSSRTDIVYYHIGTGYRWTEPTSWYNNIIFNVAVFGNYDFDGNKMSHGYYIDAGWELPNFYNFQLAYKYLPSSMCTRSTRGGPAMLFPLGWYSYIAINSDSRKPVEVGLYAATFQGGGEKQYSVQVYTQFKPLPSIALSVGPTLSRNVLEDQWVGSYTDSYATQTYGRRYVFAHLDQTTLSADIRLKWTFTPQLSLELFAQPMISSGDYRDFKEFLQPRTFDFRIYGKNGSTIREQFDASGRVSSYAVDGDGAGPAPSYGFGNPDFNVKSLRGNAVLRWEYRPGSTLYLVWTQSRSDTEPVGEFQFNRSLRRLWDARPDNIFMLKFTYWWSY